MSMMPMDKRFNQYWIIIPSVFLSLALYGFYISLAQPLVPYMDTLLFFVQIDQILKGELSWLGVYGSGEHRGIIYPFITFIEWTFWGMDSHISTALTGVVVAATFLYWLRAFLDAQPEVTINNKVTRAQLFAVCFSAAAIVISPAGFELWTLDLGFAQLFKNFLIVNFLYLLAVKQSWAKNSLSAIIFGVYGGFLILFATYGWSYPFLIACLFALGCAIFSAADTRRQAGIVIVLMLLAQAIYIYSGHGVFGGEKTNGVPGLSIINILKGIFYGASTALMGKEVMEKISLPTIIPLLFGALILLLAGLALLISLLEQTREKMFLACLLVFSLTVLAGVAVARGAVQFTNTGASRYFVDFVWLLLAPVAIVLATSGSIANRFISFKFIKFIPLHQLLLLARLLMLVLLVAGLSGHLATWYVELKTAPYRAVVFKQMAEVYKRGVSNESDASLLQSPFSVASKAIEIAQSYNLAVLRKLDAQCALDSVEYLGDWYLPEQNHARWFKKQGSIILGNCPLNVTIKGYVPQNFNARNLTIAYGDTSTLAPLIPGSEFSFTLKIPPKKRLIIHLQLDETTVPAHVGINADTRELGMLLTYIGE